MVCSPGCCAARAGAARSAGGRWHRDRRAEHGPKRSGAPPPAEALFAEAIRRALDMGHLLEGQRRDLADHLARAMVYGREDSHDWGYTPLLLLLHSATVPGAMKLFRRDLDRTELPILAEQIGGDDAAVRAVMVMAQLTGFAIVYHVLRPKAFANARGEELVTLLSGALAACIK